MYSVFLCLVLITAVIAQSVIYAPFPTTGRTTCQDGTPRKDLYAGSYYYGTKSGQTFPRLQQVTSNDDCFAQCKAESQCNAFTEYNFGGGWGACNLFLSGTKKCTSMEGGSGGASWNGVFTAMSENGYYTCSDSTPRKDLYAGRYVNCNGGATFPAKQQITSAQACATECLAERDSSGAYTCSYFTWYDFGSGWGACNLFLTNGATCTQGNSQAKGSWYRYGVWDVVTPATGETKIWSCDGTSSTYYYDPAVIQYLAQTADSIIIRSNSCPDQYIKTTSPNSYALDSLRVGRTLSFTANGDNVITSDWTGPMASSMWNTGTPSTTLSFFTIPFWACGNQNGLHLGNTDNWCKWNWSGPQQAGGISIYITRNLDANIPIWRCDRKSTGVVQTPLLPNTASYQAIGSQTKAITIYSTLNPGDYVTTTSSNAYAISSLKAGKNLAFQTNGGYAIASDWTGTKQGNMWNSCGSPGNFINDPYWACNNGGGLHLRTDVCNWISDGGSSPTGGISISIQPTLRPPVRLLRIWSCTASGTYSMEYSLTEIMSYASQATAITIMSRNNPYEYVTTGPSSFALESLRAGKTLSFSVNNDYTQSGQWLGTKVDQTWNSCGYSQGFDVAAYWACNNGNGLHLTTTVCGWTSSGVPPPGGIGIYLHMPN